MGFIGGSHNFIYNDRLAHVWPARPNPAKCPAAWEHSRPVGFVWEDFLGFGHQ